MERKLTEEHIDDIIHENRRTVSSQTPRITTVEQLIEYCEIDLDEWIIEKSEVNKWEGYRREESKELTFENGVIDGWANDTGGIHIEPIFQVKVRLVRKEPIAVRPVVSPVNLNIRYRKAKAPNESRHSRALIIADTHVGFLRNMRTGKMSPLHDRNAMSTVLSILDHVKFEEIILAGDILDLAEWSDKFVRSPDMYLTTQPAILEAAWWISQMRSRQPDAKMHYLIGNHGKRIEDFLFKHAYMAYGLKPADEIDGDDLMSLARMLDLRSMDVAYVDEYPDGKIWVNDNTVITHGNIARSKPGHTVSAVVEDAQANEIFGHIHRREIATKSLLKKNGSRAVFAMCPGCLCNINGIVPGSNSKSNWQQGVGIISYNNDITIPTIAPIENGMLYYNENTYEAWDYVPLLKEDTKWEF